MSTGHIDFDLRVRKGTGGRYWVTVNCPLFNSEVYEGKVAPLPALLVNRTERHLRSPDPIDAEALGRQLFGAVFHERNLINFWVRAKAQVRTPACRLRLNLRLMGVPELAALPWELLFDPEEDSFVALMPHVTLARMPESPHFLSAAATPHPLRILVAWASPMDQAALEVDLEVAAIRSALEAHVQTGDVELEIVCKASWAKVRRCLSERNFHVFHFVGHGHSAETKHGASLIFEDAARKGAPVFLSMLLTAFQKHPSLRLLVLNSCYSGAASSTEPFRGLAQGLINRVAAAAVSMSRPITDEAAIAFATHFYAAFSTGMALDAAMAQTRDEMHAAGLHDAWWLPILFLRSQTVEVGRLPAPAAPATWPLRTRGLVGALTLAACVAVGSWWQGTQSSFSPGLHVLPGLGARSAPDVGSSPSTRPILSTRSALGARTGFGNRPPLNTPAATPSQPGTDTSSASPAVLDGSPECAVPTGAAELGMRFRRLGPGTFSMGTAAGRDTANERPVHEVQLGAFCMQMTEVTQAQWKAVMNGANPSRNRGDARPVDSVSWNDAQRFIARLDGLAGGPRFRLPTEAEWEYAARAGSAEAYGFGDDPALLVRYGNCRNQGGGAGRHTLPVASLEPNVWGLYDLHGNVAEWVADAYSPYDDGAADNPRHPGSANSERVLRGGSWDNSVSRCRSASRDRTQPNYANERAGFRLVLDLGRT